MSKKILIVEDEEALAKALSDKFIKAGFEVVCAYDGEEGEKSAQAEKPDLIMLDIIMPKVDGLSLMKNIRTNHGDWGATVPIIMLTNLNDTESIAEASIYSVFDFLVKIDWKLDDVVELVKNKIKN